MAQHSTAAAGDRPLSFYDNLSSSATISGTSGRVIQFPDIQFRFDESIPDRRSVHSSAKSDFFGLNPALTPVNPHDPTVHRRSPQAAPPSGDDEQVNGRTATPATAHQPPPSCDGASVSASPTSTASTVPAHSLSMSPACGDAELHDRLGTSSTPCSSRPSSTIRTITIKLPDTGSGPSEAVYMTTTVPQNFAKNANTLIGRHKPTRSSLRHSRMLVVNKTVVPQRFPRGNSLNLRYVRLSKVLMVLQILIGLALTLIGLAITVWSPSTHTKDNPYWSGIVLILCGSMFLVLFAFKRGRTFTTKGVGGGQQPQQSPQQVHRWRESCFHLLHVNALAVLLLTIFFTMLAFIYALIHTTNLSSAGLRCEPQFTFNVNSSTCVCTIDTTGGPLTTVAPANELLPAPGGGTGSVSSGDDRMPEGVIRLEYRDFNCSEVHGIWYYVMVTSTLLNSVGCLTAATFLVIYAIECMRRPEPDPQRAVVCVRAAATNEQGARNAWQPDSSAVPLLQIPTAQPQPPTADSSIISGTSSRSSSSRTTGQMGGATAVGENNTLTTTLASDDLEELEVSP